MPRKLSASDIYNAHRSHETWYYDPSIAMDVFVRSESSRFLCTLPCGKISNFMYILATFDVQIQPEVSPSHSFLEIPIMLLTPTIILGLLAVVSACSDWHEERADDHSTRAAPFPPLTRPTRPLQWGDVNIIHTTDSHGWLLGHQKTSFPEPNYRCVEAPG